MSRSKKIFFFVAVVFFMLLMYISYDFSRRTTFPGSTKDSSVTGHHRDTLRRDSLASDTL